MQPAGVPYDQEVEPAAGKRLRVLDFISDLN